MECPRGIVQRESFSGGMSRVYSGGSFQGKDLSGGLFKGNFLGLSLAIVWKQMSGGGDGEMSRSPRMITSFYLTHTHAHKHIDSL